MLIRRTLAKMLPCFLHPFVAEEYVCGPAVQDTFMGRIPSRRPDNSVKATKKAQSTDPNHQPSHIISSSTTRLPTEEPPCQPPTLALGHQPD